MSPDSTAAGTAASCGKPDNRFISRLKTYRLYRLWGHRTGAPASVLRVRLNRRRRGRNGAGTTFLASVLTLSCEDNGRRSFDGCKGFDTPPPGPNMKACENPASTQDSRRKSRQNAEPRKSRRAVEYRLLTDGTRCTRDARQNRSKKQRVVSLTAAKSKGW